MYKAHIFYSGVVQGVGFRYTVQRLALSLSLKGWVKNLSDGRVEIIVEGGKETIERLCQETEGYFKDNISDKEIVFNESNSEFEDFKIAF